MLKVMSIIGTRPEAIKMAPVIKELEKHPDTIQSIVCATAQHREMFDQALGIFGIKMDHDLDLMRPNQRLTELTARILTSVGEVIDQDEPDWILVQGDTTTVMAASLAAFYAGVKIGHVEAGLRTWDRHQPFPEEINRVICDRLSDLYFAPTQKNEANLLKENVAPDDILITGNTGIDALLMTREKVQDRPLPFGDFGDRKIILLTAHRRENHGEPLQDIIRAVKDLAMQYADDVHFVFPVHLNPKVKEPVHAALGTIPNITLIEPVDYETIVMLMDRSTLILTDSGGIQEEAPSLGKPVLVMRETTERPEAVEMGAAKLVGTDYDVIMTETRRLLEDQTAYEQMASVINPYGDGRASQRIVQAILERSLESVTMAE